MMKKLTAVVAAVMVVGCSGLADVDTPLVLSLEMPTRVVAIGDSVEFMATAYNRTDQTVYIDRACGYSLDVIVVTPEGEQISVYHSMLDGGVPTCQMRWYHIAAPGERVTLPLTWKAERPGIYGAYAITRCGRANEPCPRSASMPFTVR